MAQQVQFVQLTESEFNSLRTKSPARLYFLSDTHKLYKGDQLYGSGEVQWHTHDASDIEISDIECDTIDANSIKVNGRNVSLEGHSHSMSDIDGLQSELEEIRGQIGGSINIPAQHTHTTSDITDFNFQQPNFDALKVGNEDVATQTWTDSKIAENNESAVPGIVEDTLKTLVLDCGTLSST